MICRIAIFVLGDRTDGLRQADERELTLGRSADLYFAAFRSRCLIWVYGDDPRHEIEQEPVSA